MASRLRPAGAVQATANARYRLGWLAAGLAALIVAAPAPAQLVLPAPLADPRAIDFNADPVLRFMASGSAADDFRLRIAAAVAHHPAQAEAAAGTDVVRAQRREARAALFPALSLAVVDSRSLARDFVDSSAAVERLLPHSRTDASLGADQLLFDFGATGDRIAGALARLRAATSTALSAVTAWYQLLGLTAMSELAEALVPRHRAIAADTGARVAAGLGAGGDMARAEAGLADAIAAAGTSARSLAAARARYRELFGAEAPAHPARPASEIVPIASADLAIRQSRATAEVATAEALAAAAAAEARAVRAEALPRLGAGVSGTRFNIFEPGPNHDVRATFTLRQTLSVGGAEAARSSAAMGRARAASASAERVRAEAEREAEAAYADAAILEPTVVALADAYRANRRNRDIMAEQVRLSRGSLINLLRTEADYVAAARALVASSIERDRAQYT